MEATTLAAQSWAKLKIVTKYFRFSMIFMSICEFTHKNESTIFSLTCLCIVCKKFSVLWTSEAMQWLKGGNRLVKQQFVKRHFLLLTYIQKEISQWKTWQSNHVLIKGTFLLSLILLHWLLLTFKLSILYCSSTTIW